MSLNTDLYYRITDLAFAQAITGAEVVEAVQNGKNVQFSLAQLFVAGKSAYDVAVEYGYTGAESEWLASLVGINGSSAFELAKSAGFVGSLPEWLASLKGSDGEDGINGANGLDGKSAYQVAISKGFVGTEIEWLTSIRGNPGTNGINGIDGRDGRDGINGVDGLNGSNGLNGRDGTNGTNGVDGKSAYQTAVVGGYVGSESQWLASLKGAKGDKGDAGIDGTDGTIGPDGKSAYTIAVEAGFVGTEAQWIDSLSNGPAGADGKSAYTIAIESGFVGTQAAWLASLKGTNGTNGVSGTNGLNGTNGQSAYDIAVTLGYVGTQAQWLASLNGTNGTNGVDGVDGVGSDGLDGQNGVDGKSAYEIAVLNGFVGTEIEWLASLKGADGTGGGGGGIAGEIYNPVTRYRALTTAGQSVYLSSSSTLYYGCSWTRAGANLTITHNGHGHNVSDRAIIRNANVPFQIANVTAVTANTYTVTCDDTGALNGTAAAYSMGFNYAHIGATGAITGGTLQAPSNSDVQLLSIRIHLASNTRAGSTYNLTVPKGTLNGVGLDTNMDDVYLPFQQVRQDGTTLSAVGNTIATNIGGDFGTFQFAALPAVATGLQIMASF